MSYKVTKPGELSVISWHAFIVLLFIRVCVLLVFVCMCFGCSGLSCHYLPSDWLERLL